MNVMSHSVLVLNASYEPINVITVKRAFVLICKGAAIVQERTGNVLRTHKLTLPIPAVIRLLVYRNVPRHTRSVSRKSIMIRDNYTCQYCHAALVASKLTLDHVIPKSRHGKSTWENLVSACYYCNNKKSDRTPEEAGMPLTRKPTKFSVHSRHRALAGTSLDLWQQYLFT